MAKGMIVSMKSIDNNASAARFLLGGIGTGNISLNQNARLCDFELWNVPNKKFISPYTFFAVRTEGPDGTVHTKALESQLSPPFDHSHGSYAWQVGGLPRFRHSEMSGDYPFVNFSFSDSTMPVTAKLEAFTPFIPLNTDDSSLPAAVLRYKISNKTDAPIIVSVCGSLSNLCGLTHHNIWGKPICQQGSKNQYVGRDNFNGLHFTHDNKSECDADYMEMALLTTQKEGVSYLENWNGGNWWDDLQDFWNDFSFDGQLTSGRSTVGVGNSLHKSETPMASLCIKKTVQAGQDAEFEFVISWYHPNRRSSWEQKSPDADNRPIIRNYYAKFGPALTSAAYLIENLPRLEKQSRQFADALRASTLPEYVIDEVSSTITVIRSPTCFRVEDGSFFGWEGGLNNAGSCEGNCSHVWNYSQTLAFLFPDLERSMRSMQFLYETDEDGRMYFRAYKYLEDRRHDMLPAADGQLGSIIQLYRDWKLCGDDDFLKKMWPHAKLALEYGMRNWDKDSDGVIEAQQHNTYDIEFYGLSSMINSIFYAALRAGEEISRYLGDDASANRYKSLHKNGSKILERTFNGEYYEQEFQDINEYKYQYGKGCLSDQLLGQQLAHVSGLGYVLEPEHVKSAVHSIFKYNFHQDFSDFTNVQRTYALNDESGLLLCTWPKGGRPEIPFVYSDEVWTGVEHQVASHLIYEGFVEEGLKIVEACRARHDGVKRSPWNEVECGNHYARSLASYGIILALSGFHCDAVNKTLSFRPAIHQDNFSCFFCCAHGWGVYHQKKDANTDKVSANIETLYGDLSMYKII